MTQDDCLFCKIIAGDIPSDTVFEDDTIKAFKDIHPSAPIHILVVPKVHIDSVKNLKETHSALIAQIILVARKIADGMELSGYKIVFNVGRDGGQVIDHLHLHLLAGWPKGHPDNSAPLHI